MFYVNFSRTRVAVRIECDDEQHDLDNTVIINDVTFCQFLSEFYYISSGNIVTHKYSISFDRLLSSVFAVYVKW